MRDYFKNLFAFVCRFFQEASSYDLPPEPEVTTKPSKKKDFSTWTQEEYDHVIRRVEDHKIQFKNSDETGKTRLVRLVAEINFELGKDKSYSAMSRIWRGRISRNALVSRPLILKTRDENKENT